MKRPSDSGGKNKPARWRSDRNGPRPLCGAELTDGSGDTCRRTSGRGTDHFGVGCCSLHGGCTPSGERAAHRSITAAKARGLLAGYDHEPVYDPIAVLASLAGEMVRWQQVMRDQVDELSKFDTSNEVGTEQAKAVVELYERAMQRTGRLLVDIAKLNLEERMVRIEEAQAQLVIRAVEAAFEVLPEAVREPFRLRLVSEMERAA